MRAAPTASAAARARASRSSEIAPCRVLQYTRRATHIITWRGEHDRIRHCLLYKHSVLVCVCCLLVIERRTHVYRTAYNFELEGHISTFATNGLSIQISVTLKRKSILWRLRVAVLWVVACGLHVLWLAGGRMERVHLHDLPYRIPYTHRFNHPVLHTVRHRLHVLLL